MELRGANTAARSQAFRHTVARLLLFICVHREGGHTGSTHDAPFVRDVAASDVDLRIDCTQTVLAVAQHTSYVYVHHEVGFTRLWSTSLLICLLYRVYFFTAAYYLSYTICFSCYPKYQQALPTKSSPTLDLIIPHSHPISTRMPDIAPEGPLDQHKVNQPHLAPPPLPLSH